MSDTANSAGRPTRRQFVQTLAGAAVGAFAAPAIVPRPEPQREAQHRHDRRRRPRRAQPRSSSRPRTSSRSATSTSRPSSRPRPMPSQGAAATATSASSSTTPTSSTPSSSARCEHTHAFATLPALQLGKHVYCEKPLTHNIWEARVIREAAAQGQGRHPDGHPDPRQRQLPPRRRADPGRRHRPGARGPRLGRRAPGAGSREEAAKRNKDIVYVDRAADRGRSPSRPGSTGTSGSAPRRRGRSTTSTVPGPKWYRWWDFGNGTMSDLGSHWNDLPFWALKLEAPADRSRRSARRRTRRSPRRRCTRPTNTAPRGDMPPVKLHLVPGRGQARALDETARSRKWDRRRAVRRRQGDAPVRLRQARAAAREGVRGLQAARAVDPEVARPSRRVDPRLQDRRADDAATSSTPAG